MSEVKANFSINAFPGSKTHGLAWPAMRRHLVDVARGIYTNTQDNLGIVAYLVSDAKYSEIFFMYHGRSPLSEEDSPLISSSSSMISVDTAPKTKKYTFPKMPDQSTFNLKNKDQLTEYKFQMKNWQDEINAVEVFRARLLSALDEVALSSLGKADERVNLKLKEIYEGLDLRFSTVSNNELRRELKKIRDPIATISSFDSVIQLHTDVHQLCEDQNMPLSENQKIIELQSSLENFPCFDIQYTLFDSAHEIKSNKRTFKTLATNCLKHWHGLDDKGAGNTTGAHGYANASKAQRKEPASTPSAGFEPTSNPSVEERFTRSLEKMEFFFANAAKSTKGSEANQGKRKKLHCDNHGWCSHETSQCRDNKKSPKNNQHSFPNLKSPNGKKS